jgi:hypothetical protein
MVLGLIDVADKFGADERKKVIGILTIVKTKSILPTADYTGNTAKIDFMQYAAVLERHTSLINTCLLLKPGTSHILLRLTVKAVQLNRLNFTIKGFIRAFRKINDKCRKRNQRGNGIKLVGIKSWESNFNPTKKTYNPHLHLIVANSEIAQLFICEWLQIWTSKHTHKIVQYSVPVHDKEKALIEIIK